jgi:hypothetical protein
LREALEDSDVLEEDNDNSSDNQKEDESLEGEFDYDSDWSEAEEFVSHLSEIDDLEGDLVQDLVKKYGTLALVFF